MSLNMFCVIIFIVEITATFSCRSDLALGVIGYEVWVMGMDKSLHWEEIYLISRNIWSTKALLLFPAGGCVTMDEADRINWAFYFATRKFKQIVFELI